MQDPISKKKYQGFLKTIIKKQKVYSLENDEGIASADSIVFDNEDGAPKGMIFFWSEERLAQAHCNGEWSDYAPRALTLTQFLENVCVGLFTDQHVVGTNFDASLIGYEIEPLALILDCLAKLRKAGIELSLTRYENMKTFDLLVREQLG